MFNTHTKFEVYDYLGDLWVMHRVYLWLDKKRIANFLLVVIDFFASSQG